jgi:hypothetical protein
MWLNEVAHGDRAALKLAVGYRPEVALLLPTMSDRDGDEPWRHAQAVVAAELQGRTEGSDETLSRLQTQALFALEDVIDDQASPDQLVALALTRLREVPA